MKVWTKPVAVSVDAGFEATRYLPSELDLSGRRNCTRQGLRLRLSAHDKAPGPKPGLSGLHLSGRERREDFSAALASPLSTIAEGSAS